MRHLILFTLFFSAGCNDSAVADAGDLAPAADLATPPDLTPEKVPIEHVIVVVKENHTFDNYFGSFPGAEGNTMCKLKSGTIPCPRAPDRTPRDLDHGHDAALTDWDHGKMDGWKDV